MKLFKFFIKFLIPFALGVAATLGCLWVTQEYNPFGKGKTSLSVVALEQSFEDIAELATESFTASNVGTFTEEKAEILGRIHIPFTGKRLALAYESTVKVGVRDLTKVKITLDESKKTVKVNVPQVEILDAYIDPNSVQVVDQTFSVINRVSPEDVTTLLGSELERVRQAALDGDALRKARDHAESVVKSHVKALLLSTTYETFDIVVTFGDEPSAQGSSASSSSSNSASASASSSAAS